MSRERPAEPAPTFHDQHLLSGLYVTSSAMAEQYTAAARTVVRVARQHGRCSPARPGGPCRHRNHRRDQAALLLYLEALGLEGVMVDNEIPLPAQEPEPRRPVPSVLAGLLREAS